MIFAIVFVIGPFKMVVLFVLRVADTLYNPFGEDDDDFELNELINRWLKIFHLNNPDLNFLCTPRHFRVGMSIVDSTKPAPPLRRDVFWDQVKNTTLHVSPTYCGWKF